MRGLLVIGHGSRRWEANATVRELARQLADDQRWEAAVAAFLEVSHPDIAEGYGVLAAGGCTEIIAYPFFLFDGNHTHRDIPAALEAARESHPATRWVLSEPLGLHACVIEAVRARLADTLVRTASSGDRDSR
ncbi:CbiX/SirB N-terminal domain-containing protein [Frankia sp. AgPm24]|uniref:CbiX/SirB N-terminal domain-containing protein n=1 Tax=Frankia umida TaxID=573489 RepID=A0ABT0JTF7_9ACTN|nr:MULTISPECIES: CbiX/SirB N-terminal domain-containing protein [Frankia]MCK9874789.1 CbiX/SirB N-terminal domain-containing protein [Frankia umida]MCK9924536.1 CbiX/SirB N-terminal domain-containing protein [Frankia sp. AgPm24]